MPVSDASTSTINWRSGLGKMSTGAVVKSLLRVPKASSASGVQTNGMVVEVSAERGAVTRLNPLMNHR